jgi:hypothetical protein
METKQTAVQQLIEDIKIGTLSDHIDGVEYFSKDVVLELLENAKQIEKQQIIQAYQAGDGDAYNQEENFGEHYYNETYA